MKIKCLPKSPFFTIFSKINGPTKIDTPGTWRDNTLLQNASHIFFVVYCILKRDFMNILHYDGQGKGDEHAGGGQMYCKEWITMCN